MSSLKDSVGALYHQLLNGWNQRDARAMAQVCLDDGIMVGFDGSQMNGQKEIVASLQPIFAGHPTAAYVACVRDVKLLSPDVAVLTAVAGMVPPGKDDIEPEKNAVQTLLAVRRQGEWRVALFQNTPAAFDGRPEEREKLSQELRSALRERGGDGQADRQAR